MKEMNQRLVVSLTPAWVFLTTVKRVVPAVRPITGAPVTLGIIALLALSTSSSFIPGL
jgi:hypothetical protein